MRSTKNETNGTAKANKVVGEFIYVQTSSSHFERNVALYLTTFLYLWSHVSEYLNHPFCLEHV